MENKKAEDSLRSVMVMHEKMEAKKMEELLMNVIIEWFDRYGWSNRKLARYYSHLKPITDNGIKAKLIKILGKKEYDRIKEKWIKHKGRRKYYESKKRTTK